MTRIRAIVTAAALLILPACGAHNYWSGASVRDVSTLVFYGAQRKELMFVRTPCTRSDKPALVSAWVREKDIGNMIVVCDTECDCRLTKRTPSMKIVAAPAESGICQ